MERMKEPDGEGVANHSGPESCVGTREGDGEALTGVHAGWVLSLENAHFRESRRTCRRAADLLTSEGRQHRLNRDRKGQQGTAWSETPRAHGTISGRTGEISCSTSADGAEVRDANPRGALRR